MSRSSASSGFSASAWKGARKTPVLRKRSFMARDGTRAAAKSVFRSEYAQTIHRRISLSANGWATSPGYALHGLTDRSDKRPPNKQKRARKKAQKSLADQRLLP